VNSKGRLAASRSERFEIVVLVLILLTVGGFAGAASFRHVHDWTMTNSPTGTGSWFGWANAVVSELVPIAALLVMRRRRRTGQPIGYPATLLVLALALSVTAQLAVARPSLSGAVVSVVPALAFAALAKLVLGKAPKADETPAGVQQLARDIPAAVVPLATQQIRPGEEDPSTVPVAAPPIPDGNEDRSAVPASFAVPDLPEAVTAELVHAARRAAVAVLKQTGRPITRDELREHLRVRTETASEVLRLIRDRDDIPATKEAATPINGRPIQDLIGTVTR